MRTISRMTRPRAIAAVFAGAGVRTFNRAFAGAFARILARALAALALAAGGAGPAWAQPATPDLLTPCVFAHDEILEALELDVEGSQLADMKLPGGRDVGCLYTVKRSQTVLTVRQTWDPANPGPGTPPVEPGFLPIPGDRDRAATRTGPPDEPGAELVYWRGKVKTRLFVHGPTLDANAMLQKLLKLRRVP
jgi:hypothetical protein